MQDVNVDIHGSNNHHVPSLGLLALPPAKTICGKLPGKGSYWGKFILMVSITSCVVILFSSIISKARQERFRMLETKKVLDKHVAQLEAVNSGLEKEYSALKSDPVRIEKEAREILGYIGIDEVFYEKYNFRIRSTSKKEPVEIVPQNKWKTFLFDGPFPWQFPALIILIAAAYYLISYHYEYRKLRQSNC
ncbi:MAG: septum formation initiator family protein [Candidatus Brocadia sp.]|jgi:cell division protein FtsB